MLRACALFALVSSAAPAFAAPLDVRLTLEPGVATLAQTAERERRFGYLGGAALAVGVSDLLAIELSFDRQDFHTQAPPKRLDAWAASLVYTIDVLWVTPFVTLGMARTSLVGEVTELVPQLGLGFDAAVGGLFSLGAVVRYLPVGGTDLLTAPGAATLHLRLGVRSFW